ncbi:MAG TPA: efflux RND transporter periplasmic adaptor subunit [Steroidobacteraceae bacterium]|nr:efflux RND transporter periplasmic adaptor subunit [Steroidobacteraceae bacterium]
MRIESRAHPVAVASILAGVAGLAVLAGCAKRNQYQPPPAPPVTVSKPLRMPVTDYLQSTGSVAAFKSVDLMARVEGYLRSVNFKDGSVVKAGQLLFVIEPEPYQAKLASYQAQLLNAQSEYERQLRMIKENATSQANVDKWLSQRDQAAAAVTLAKINLGYTRVTAPFDGRIDRHLVDPGNLVGSMGSATKLATIEQINPAYVYFSINERDLLRVRAAVQAHSKAVGEAPAVPVQIGLQTDEGYPHGGTLDFASGGLDTGSGTLQLRANVPNARFTLLPGLFARVRIALAEPVQRLVVPDRVVSSDQVGSYLLLVGPDQKVRQQRIETGPLQNGLRAVLAGLDENSEVVIDGLQNAIPGNLVTATERPLTPPAYQAASAR